ncbi:hypothetical protein [Tenuibacillus multivorans]|uniref:hypothetical protein n=1 Tax=Tenuibacillus multivorans TaxID=237069 RepID=UPI0015A4806D|nr:hypothetical protein [Tenuibacillus multivorans]
MKPFRNGTLIELHETGYSNSKADQEACIDCATGWGEAMTLLKIYLERGLTFKDDL